MVVGSDLNFSCAYLRLCMCVRLPERWIFGCRRIGNSDRVSRRRDKFQQTRCSLISYILLVRARVPRALLLQATPSDGLPAVVCCECRDQLDVFYRFRENALTVESRLKEYLSSTKQLTAADCNEVSGLVSIHL